MLQQTTSGLLSIITATLLIAFSVLVVSTMPVRAAPIPAGCPGSPKAGPPKPGVCAKIPAGCPGSTKSGPKNPKVKCPFTKSGSTSGSKPKGGDPAADPKVNCSKQGCDLIGKYINPLINLLSLSFGIIAAISIIMGGIQYAAATGDPQKISLAKRRISNTILAILAFLFLYSFLQFLVPGGIFKQ